MNKLSELDNIAKENDIEVMEIKAEKCASMSIMTEGGDCYIGIDSRNMTSAEETVCMAHEVGHCQTGAFYNKHSKYDLISKNEKKADIWAIQKLIDRDELKKVMKTGCTGIWELAEHFGVTEDFIRKACDYYGFLIME